MIVPVGLSGPLKSFTYISVLLVARIACHLILLAEYLPSRCFRILRVQNVYLGRVCII